MRVFFCGVRGAMRKGQECSCALWLLSIRVEQQNMFEQRPCFELEHASPKCMLARHPFQGPENDAKNGRDDSGTHRGCLSRCVHFSRRFPALEMVPANTLWRSSNVLCCRSTTWHS